VPRWDCSALGPSEDRNNSTILKCVKIVSWWFYVAYRMTDWVRKERILSLVSMALAIIHCRQAVLTKWTKCKVLFVLQTVCRWETLELLGKNAASPKICA
jgi:hypothetical protein